MNCFACGKPITNKNVNCPYCGYRFTVDEDNYCPNCNFGVCAITENMCNKGIYFQDCNIKEEAERKSPF